MPQHVSLLVERTDGRPMSVLIGLRRNGRDQLDVRLADGMRVYDGRHIYDLVETSDGGVELVELVHEERAAFGVEGRLLGVERGHVWFEGPEGRTRCRLETRECAPASGDPDLPLTHPGPAPGFEVTLSGGELRILLPTSKEPLLVAEGVGRVVGVQWVRAEAADAEPVLNRTFRGQATVRALARPATLDGDLSEWRDLPTAVVGSPWQLQSGARGWDGPRDGSFGIAAAWSTEEVCFAGRVRDDHLTASDRLHLHVADTRVEVPLLGPAPPEARLVPAWFGVAFEACLSLAAMPPKDELPFAALLVDADDDLPPTLLATAPEEAGRALGRLLLLGPDRAIRRAAAPASGPRRR